MSGNGQGNVTDSPRLAALRARLAAAEVARDAARAAITEEERAELELRKRLATAEEERSAEEQAKRQIDLDRREEAARDAYPEAKIVQLAIQGYDDTFILMAAPKAHAKWEQDYAAAATNKKIDRAEVNRTYAVQAVIDWNGVSDFGPASLNGHALIEFLKKHPGIVKPIVNAAAKLAGYFAEDHKS